MAWKPSIDDPRIVGWVFAKPHFMSILRGQFRRIKKIIFLFLICFLIEGCRHGKSYRFNAKDGFSEEASIVIGQACLEKYFGKKVSGKFLPVLKAEPTRFISFTTEDEGPDSEIRGVQLRWHPELPTKISTKNILVLNITFKDGNALCDIAPHK